jgi:hypothetical protein
MTAYVGGFVGSPLTCQLTSDVKVVSDDTVTGSSQGPSPRDAERSETTFCQPPTARYRQFEVADAESPLMGITTIVK